MSIPPLHAVVAVAQNGVIGMGNALPWKLRSDLQRFKRITMGHALLMGRKTYESIGKPLPGRQTIVLSRSHLTAFDGVCVASSIDHALEMVKQDSMAFVVGGAEIYRIAMPHISNLYLTRVLANVEGDAFMEPIDEAQFSCVERSFVPKDEFNEWPTEFLHLVRNGNQPL
jgi:dihydrofolate reductase